MKKRGQAYTQILQYFLAIVIIGVIFLFGYNAVAGVKNKNCQVQYVSFMKQLDSFKQTLEFGDVRNSDFVVPCDVNKIIMVDESVNQSLATLDDYPVINDALESEGTNVFFFKDHNLKKQFRVEKIKVGFPYYVCFKPVGSKTQISLTGNGNGISLFNSRKEFDCSATKPQPLELSREDVTNMLSEISSEFIETNLNNLKDATACNISRIFTQADGETNVTITNNGCSFSFYEKLPKCAIQSIVEAQDSGMFSFSVPLDDLTIISDDPLIMWDFSDTNASYTYMIKKLIEDNCKREFVGLAADTVVIPPAEIAAEISSVGSTNPVAETALNDAQQFIDTDLREKPEFKNFLRNVLNKVGKYERERKPEDRTKIIDEVDNRLDQVARSRRLDSSQKNTLTQYLNNLRNEYK